MRASSLAAFYDHKMLFGKAPTTRATWLRDMKGRLPTQIALRIIDHIRQNELPKGHHLPAQELADLFKVSRAPVNAALKLLVDTGIVFSIQNRGHFVEKSADKLRELGSWAIDEDADEAYFAIAEDRLSGRLPERVSENELMRQYGVSRGRLRSILARAAEEGWIARLPGHGWEFLSILTSAEGYEQAYRFRAEVETAAVLLPGYQADAVAFKTARDQQRAMLDGDMFRLSRSQLFKANAEFHEMLVACSGNQFFVDALKRVNRVRRLMEYRISIDRTRLIRQSREHLEILDLLESGSFARASMFLREHILTAWQVKRSGVAAPQGD
jgi:DNA-binding GntR family transcriptional regulator